MGVFRLILKIQIVCAVVLLVGLPAATAFNDKVCDDQKDMISCRWKIICFKDPDEPNKIIPADCAQNYTPPAPTPEPAQTGDVSAAPAEQPQTTSVRTSLEKLYYMDLRELDDDFLTPPKELANEDALAEDNERSVANKKGSATGEKAIDPKKEDTAEKSKIEKALPTSNNNGYKGRVPVEAFRKQDEYY